MVIFQNKEQLFESVVEHSQEITHCGDKLAMETPKFRKTSKVAKNFLHSHEVVFQTVFQTHRSMETLVYRNCKLLKFQKYL